MRAYSFAQILGNLLRCVCVTVLCLVGAASYATIDVYEFASDEQEKTFNELAAELRCPQCQNNNIAESNAAISNDMRAKVYELLQQDYTKQQVVDYMVARYGNFVTYNPPLTPATVILWLAPGLALLLGGGVLVYRSRKVKVQGLEGADNNVAEPLLEGSLVDESQEVLLTSAAELGSLSGRMAGWFWVCAILFVVLLSAVIYSVTGSWKQVQAQTQVHQALPQLRERALNGNEQLNAIETTNLAAGLRSELLSNPDDIGSWMLLGSVYRALGDYGQAMQAYARAYSLRPDDNLIKSIYGQFLLQLNRESDNHLGVTLLREVIAKDPIDTRSISALAMYAYGQKNYEEAIALMERLLVILPKDNSRRAVIEQSLEQIKQEYRQSQ